MIIVWEACDIKAGRRTGRPERTERWMIGYDSTVETALRWTLISLTDGMVSGRVTKEDLAASLTSRAEVPEELLDCHFKVTQ